MNQESHQVEITACKIYSTCIFIYDVILHWVVYEAKIYFCRSGDEDESPELKAEREKERRQANNARERHVPNGLEL